MILNQFCMNKIIPFLILIVHIYVYTIYVLDGCCVNRLLYISLMVPVFLHMISSCAFKLYNISQFITHNSKHPNVGGVVSVPIVKLRTYKYVQIT